MSVCDYVRLFIVYTETIYCCVSHCCRLLKLLSYSFWLLHIVYRGRALKQLIPICVINWHLFWLLVFIQRFNLIFHMTQLCISVVRSVNLVLLQLFDTWNLLFSSLIHAALSFQHISSSPLFPQTTSVPTWALLMSWVILYYYSILLQSLVPLLLISSSVLFSGEKGFSQWEPRALIPVLSSVWLLLLPLLTFPLSLSIWLSLSLSQFDRDLNKLCGDYTVSLN